MTPRTLSSKKRPPKTRKRKPARGTDSAGTATSKKRIVEAATACFIELGINDTRFSDIAKRAGVDHPLVRYYFPTQLALHYEVVASVLDQFRDYTFRRLEETSADPAQMLKTYVELQFDWALSNRGLFSIWLHFYYLASCQPRMAEMNRLIRETGRERVRAILFEGFESGRFRKPEGPSARELAAAIHGFLSGNFIVAFTESGSDPKAVAKATWEMIRLWLGIAR